MSSMRAIGAKAFGADLEFVDVPRPSLENEGPTYMIVKLQALGVNPIDGKMVARNESYGDDGKPYVPGFDGLGVVEEIGAEVTRFAKGDTVFFAGDWTRRGCHAEYVAIDSRISAKAPTKVAREDASPLPLVFLTAWESLFENMGISPNGENTEGKTLLIINGAGGVGSIATQLAKKLTKLTVVATASRDVTIEFCKKNGADHVINHHNNLAEQITAAGLGKVEYIFNTASFGGDTFAKLVEPLAPLGHFCTIATPTSPIDPLPLFFLRGHFSMELMFTRSMMNAEPEKQGAVLERLAQMLDDGSLVSTVTTKLPWDKFTEAFELINSGKNFGRVALSVE